MSNDISFRFSMENTEISLLRALDALLRDETMVDVTLASEGRFLRAHRLILCTYSDYFKGLLTLQPDKHPIVFLRDIPFNHVEALVAFMYRGEVTVPQNDVLDFMKTAESLGVKGLSQDNPPPDADTEFVNQSSESLPSPENGSSQASRPTRNRTPPRPVRAPKSSACGSKRLRSKSLNEPNCGLSDSVEGKRIRTTTVGVTSIDTVTTISRQISKASTPCGSTFQTNLPVISNVQSVTVMPTTKSQATLSAFLKEAASDENELCNRMQPKVKKPGVVLITENLGEEQQDENVSELPESSDKSSEEIVITETPVTDDLGVVKGLDVQQMEDQGVSDLGSDNASSGYQFTCSHCARSYKLRDNLNRHMKYECSVVGQMFSCPLCDYKTKRRHRLLAHMNKNHDILNW